MNNKMHSIAYIKRLAKAIKKEKGITHTEALELISREHGYFNWQHYSKILNQQANIEVKVVTEHFTITFTDWLVGHKNRNSPLGELARNMNGDKTWPSNDTLHGYENYLMFRGASDSAIETLNKAWKTHAAYLKRKNSPVSTSTKPYRLKSNHHDPRRIVFVKNARPIPFPNRTVEKFNPLDKAWISWEGKKAIPVTVLEVDDRHYTIRIERPLRKVRGTNFLFLDEVRHTPELACMNHVTF